MEVVSLVVDVVVEVSIVVEVSVVVEVVSLVEVVVEVVDVVVVVLEDWDVVVLVSMVVVLEDGDVVVCLMLAKCHLPQISAAIRTVLIWVPVSIRCTPNEMKKFVPWYP